MGLFNIFANTTRLRRLEDQVEQLQRDQKALETEWSSVYDSVRRTLAKLARRDQREREASPDAPGSTNGAQATLDLNEQIRASRRGIR